MVKKMRIRYVWWANLSVNLPIIAAIIGFVYAIILLYPSGIYNDNLTYHNLTLGNKDGLVKKAINSKLIWLTIAENRMQSSASKDTLKKIQNLIGQSEIELNNLDYLNVDTSLKYFSKYFSVNRNDYLNILKSNWGDDKMKKVEVSMIDSLQLLSYKPFIRKDSLEILKKDSELISYLDNNTAFGLWFFCSIAQMTLWFILAVIVVGSVKNTDEFVPELTYNFKNAFFFSILPIITVAVFTWLLYEKLIASFVISDTYFLNGFNSKMVWYSAVGYLVAIICFSGYLFLSNKLELLNSFAQKNNKSLNNDLNLERNYKELKKAFDLTFLFSAIILSVFVVWLGLLFNSVNGIEAMRYYNFISGRPLLNYDFVYLIGLIHSLLLLIFYIPVKLRFNSLELKQENDVNKQGENNSKKYFQTLWDSLSAILVTASPLITTIVQKIIANILQG